MSRRHQLLGPSRYELLLKIASGGTATVYVGRRVAAEGFQRLVALKRAHPHLRDDPTSRRMLVREATLASGIHHVNVVSILDIEESDDELLLVMTYVEGGSLADLLDASLARGADLGARVTLRIVLDACAGLQAVHGLNGDDGRPLGFVHRDVSPQNILVGLDGTSRLTDFGLAKLTEVSMSRTASLKGKIAYMAPEYVHGAPFTQQCDIFSMGVVLWEALTGKRLFRGRNEADTIRRLTQQPAPVLSSLRPELAAFDGSVARALAKAPGDRYGSVAELSEALTVLAASESACAARTEVVAAVEQLLGPVLEDRREVLRSCTVDPADPDGGATASELHRVVPELDVAPGASRLEAAQRDRRPSQPRLRYPRSDSSRDTQTAPAAPQALAELAAEDEQPSAAEPAVPSPFSPSPVPPEARSRAPSTPPRHEAEPSQGRGSISRHSPADAASVARLRVNVVLLLAVAVALVAVVWVLLTPPEDPRARDSAGRALVVRDRFATRLLDETERVTERFTAARPTATAAASAGPGELHEGRGEQGGADVAAAAPTSGKALHDPSAVGRSPWPNRPPPRPTAGSRPVDTGADGLPDNPYKPRRDDP